MIPETFHGNLLGGGNPCDTRLLYELMFQKTSLATFMDTHACENLKEPAKLRGK